MRQKENWNCNPANGPDTEKSPEAICSSPLAVETLVQIRLWWTARSEVTFYQGYILNDVYPFMPQAVIQTWGWGLQLFLIPFRVQLMLRCFRRLYGREDHSMHPALGLWNLFSQWSYKQLRPKLLPQDTGEESAETLSHTWRMSPLLPKLPRTLGL